MGIYDEAEKGSDPIALSTLRAALSKRSIVSLVLRLGSFDMLQSRA